MEPLLISFPWQSQYLHRPGKPSLELLVKSSSLSWPRLTGKPRKYPCTEQEIQVEDSPLPKM